MSSQDIKRAFKNSLLLFIRMIIVLLIGLYTSRVILKVLGFEDFGIYNVVGSVVIFFSFFNTALTNATSRYLTFELGRKDYDVLKKTYSMAINSHIILALGLLIVLEIMGVWFINNQLNIPNSRMNATNWCFQFSLLTFCVQIIKVPFHSCVIAYEKMNFFAVISIVEKLLQLVIVFLLTNSTLDKLILYAFLLFVVSVVILFSYIIFCKCSFSECSYSNCWDRNMIKKFASYSGYSMLVNCADIMSVQSRNVFFNWFVGPIANAALGVANQVISLFNMFLDNFSKAIQPQIIKSYAANDLVYFNNLLFSASKLNYYLLLFISIPIIINLDYLLNIWLDNFPELTIPFVKAIVIYTIVDALQQPLWIAVHATGNLKVHQILISSIKILSIPITYLVLYCGYSTVIALYCWVGLNVICAIVRTIYMKYLISLNLCKYLRDVIFRIFIVSIIVVPISYYLSNYFENELTKMIMSTIINTIIIIPVILFLGISSKERNLLFAMIHCHSSN